MAFAAAWLALREPYDAAARDPDLPVLLAAWLDRQPCPRMLVDLGSGTGANLRWLAPRLGAPQRWQLIEHDRALIEAGRAMPALAESVRWLQADLAGPPDRLLPEGTALVAASALLDLVGTAWLDRWFMAVLAHGAALYVALTVDGRVAFDPPHAHDVAVLALVERHQATEKGLGSALGGRAPAALRDRLTDAGGGLHERRSDWRLGPDDPALQAKLIDGYAQAAAAIEPAAAALVVAWRGDRLAQLQAGSRLLVGHCDQLWIPGA